MNRQRRHAHVQPNHPTEGAPAHAITVFVVVTVIIRLLRFTFLLGPWESGELHASDSRRTDIEQKEVAQMEPIYPLYEDDYDDDDLDDNLELCIQAATHLTTAAMQSQLLKAGASTEETAEQVMLFFDIAYRRIRDLAEEDDDDFIDQIEEDGEIEPL